VIVLALFRVNGSAPVAQNRILSVAAGLVQVPTFSVICESHSL